MQHKAQLQIWSEYLETDTSLNEGRNFSKKKSAMLNKEMSQEAKEQNKQTKKTTKNPHT